MRSGDDAIGRRLKNLPSPAMMSTDTSKGTVSATAAPRSAAAYGLHRTSTVHTPPAELTPLYRDDRPQARLFQPKWTGTRRSSMCGHERADSAYLRSS